MARRGGEGLNEFAAMMVLANDLEFRWQRIVLLRDAAEELDWFDIESAIDGFNARCRAIARLVAEAADTSIEAVTEAYRPRNGGCWFECGATASPAETLRQIARHRTLDPALWTSRAGQSGLTKVKPDEPQGGPSGVVLQRG